MKEEVGETNNKGKRAREKIRQEDMMKANTPALSLSPPRIFFSSLYAHSLLKGKRK